MQISRATSGRDSPLVVGKHMPSSELCSSVHLFERTAFRERQAGRWPMPPNVLRQPVWGRPRLIRFVCSCGHEQIQIEGTSRTFAKSCTSPIEEVLGARTERRRTTEDPPPISKFATNLWFDTPHPPCRSLREPTSVQLVRTSGTSACPV
jgi:hypothetical protein